MSSNGRLDVTNSSCRHWQGATGRYCGLICIYTQRCNLHRRILVLRLPSDRHFHGTLFASMHPAKGPAASLLGGLRPGNSAIRRSVWLGQLFLSSSISRPIHNLTMSLSKSSPSRSAVNNVRFPSCLRNTTFARNLSDGRPGFPLNRDLSLLFRPSTDGVSGNRQKYFERAVNTQSISCRQFHVSQLRSYDRFQTLEDAANRDRDNANAQAIFFQVRVS